MSCSTRSHARCSLRNPAKPHAFSHNSNRSYTKQISNPFHGRLHRSLDVTWLLLAQPIDAAPAAATVVQIISTFNWKDFPVLVEISGLITEVFYEDSDYAATRSPGPLSRLSHRLSNLAWSSLLHMARPFNQYTLYISLPPAHQGQASKVVGSVVVSFERLQGQAATAIGAGDNAAVAWVSSLAVDPVHRKQGLATSLLQTCEDLVLASIPGGCYVCLHVYYHNVPAQRLYERQGYQRTDWVDPKWLEAAEKGEMGPPRKVLMFKSVAPGSAALAEALQQQQACEGQASVGGVGAM